jgi:calcineurin-like phosphoesterase family protein
MTQHKTFFTADLHLGHAKIIEFEPARQHFSSIEEHDKAITE